MLAAVRSATLFGVEGRPVTVEVHVATSGLPAFQIVGLPDEACRESRDRVRAAVLSSGLQLAERARHGEPRAVEPAQGRLGPRPRHRRRLARRQRSGARRAPSTGLGFIAELGLDGSLRAVSGVAPMVAAMRPLRPVVSTASYREAEGVAGEQVRVAGTLRELVDALNADAPWPRPPDDVFVDDEPPLPDLADVRGQRQRQVGAGGGRCRWASPAARRGARARARPCSPNACPGCCRRWCRRCRSRPPWSTLRPACACPPEGWCGGRRSGRRTTAAPWCRWWAVAAPRCARARSRWPTVASSSWTSSASSPQSCSTGCASRWRKGVIRLARARASASLPARFLLVAATNPCPCGGGPPGRCECDDAARLRYLRRLSGPLLDRFDLRVGVDRPDVDDLLAGGGGEPTVVVAARVAAARRQCARPHRRAQRRHPGVAPRRDGAVAPRRALATARAARGRARSPVAAITASGGLPAPSPTSHGAPEVVLEEHVVMALQLRVRLQVSSRDVARMSTDRPAARRTPRPWPGSAR